MAKAPEKKKAVKKAKKVFKLEDFFVQTLNDKPSKMMLLLNNEETGHWLGVLGSLSPKLKRPIADYRRNLAKCRKKGESIKDDLERAEYESETMAELDLVLASEMLETWSFDGATREDALRVLSENEALPNAVIAHSFDSGNYATKK